MKNIIILGATVLSYTTMALGINHHRQHAQATVAHKYHSQTKISLARTSYLDEKRSRTKKRGRE
jgi:hypothetical protein